MEICWESLLAGAHQAQSGTVVVIDVFRAFTSVAVLLSAGAREVIMVAQPEEALSLRRQGRGELAVGEVGGKRPPGFDGGNSPFELMSLDCAGRVVIQSTRAGTVGITAVPAAGPLYAAALVTAQATVRAVSQARPARVYLIAMGRDAQVRTDEDELCAMYLRNLFAGRQPDAGCVRALIGAGGEIEKFRDPDKPHFHPRDPEIALDIDRFSFAVRVERQDGLLVARQQPVAGAALEAAE
ncbi:MAG: 2-phosphosulfolactate phosphatase [Candidatus Omnitrophica bacterium]|nr:2-phosphosulfolactate phosphatase [Candidatus Omnitrophota bacterium]